MMLFDTVITAETLIGLQMPVVVIDCRHDLADTEAGRRAYAEAHIPGSHFLHLDADLSGSKTTGDGSFRGRHPLPEPADFIQTLQRLGIDDHTQVIAYDAHGGMFAARVWWMLRWVGHAAVAVLDGGLPAWVEAGGTLSTAPAEPTTGHIAHRPSLVKTVTADQVLANLDAPTLRIIDARAPDRFRGENETLDRVGGHIPGATNRFFKNNLQATGHFKSPELLRTEFDSLIGDATKTVMQCGSGVTACHHLLALEIAGRTGALLYPGSWSEWSSDPARPVALGDAG
jgi:thiosulfate/3-mercaptopyruvate sulfurtransferase